MPPTFLMILIFFKSTLSAVLWSIVLRTASTAMGPNRFEYCETILEDNDVDAACKSVALSDNDIGWDMSVNVFTAAAAARWKDSEMTVGCMP